MMIVFLTRGLAVEHSVLKATHFDTFFRTNVYIVARGPSNADSAWSAVRDNSLLNGKESMKLDLQTITQQ